MQLVDAQAELAYLRRKRAERESRSLGGMCSRRASVSDCGHSAAVLPPQLPSEPPSIKRRLNSAEYQNDEEDGPFQFNHVVSQVFGCVGEMSAQMNH